MNSTLKGVLYVALGASSYGMLATIVKIAYSQGFTTAEVTLAQFFFGIIVLWLLTAKIRKKDKPSQSQIKKLMLAGTTMGCTSVFYYLCVRYLNASVAVVFLMQSVWIGIVIEMLQTRKFPALIKIVAVILVLFGTVLATQMWNFDTGLNVLGVVFGMLAAISFSLTLYSTNSVATGFPPTIRSLYMLFGGGIIVLIFALCTQILPYYLGFSPQFMQDFVTSKPIDSSIFYTWGIILSLFGTVLPPILLNKGFPLTGVGLGSIVSSLELPVSVTFAFVLLSETVTAIQWLGITVILFAVVLMNINLIRKKT